MCMKISLNQYKKLLEDIDGISEKELKRIDEKSSYNHNFYYFSKNSIHYIVLGESDDDTETEWWWCVGDVKLLIGYSWISDEIIHTEENIHS